MMATSGAAAGAAARALALSAWYAAATSLRAGVARGEG